MSAVKRAAIRLMVCLALFVATWVSSIIVAFRHPEMTVAQRWISHPGEMSVAMVLGLATAAIGLWPRSKRARS